MAIVERASPVLSAVRLNPFREAESTQVRLEGTEVIAATFRHQARPVHINSAADSERNKQALAARDAALKASGIGTKFSASA